MLMTRAVASAPSAGGCLKQRLVEQSERLFVRNARLTIAAVKRGEPPGTGDRIERRSTAGTVGQTARAPDLCLNTGLLLTWNERSLGEPAPLGAAFKAVQPKISNLPQTDIAPTELVFFLRRDL
jgi:hypothetical protein